MPDIATGALGAVSLLSSSMQVDAAEDAASLQAAGTREQTAEYRRQFDAVQKLLLPYATTGTDALSQSRQLLGLGGLPGYGGNAGGASYEDIRNRLIGQFTTTTQGTMPQLPVGVNSVAGVKDGQQGYFVENFQGGSDFMPMVQGTQGGTSIDEAGLEAAIQAELSGQQAGQQAGMGTADQQQAAAIAKFENSPYFQAIVRQSEDAMLQNASATGGLRGGNTQDALSKNRPILLQGLIDKQLANLAGLASQGQNAAAGVGNAGIQTGKLIGNATGMGAAAQAGGVLGQSNATVGALGNVAGMFGGRMAGTNPFANIGSSLQSSFSQTPMGSSGFGTGLAYGNQDLGAFL